VKWITKETDSLSLHEESLYTRQQNLTKADLASEIEVKRFCIET